MNKKNNCPIQYLFFFLVVFAFLAMPIAGLAQVAPGTKIIYSTQEHRRSDAYIYYEGTYKSTPQNAQYHCLQWTKQQVATWSQAAASLAAEVECSEVTPVLAVAFSSFQYKRSDRSMWIGNYTVDAGPGLNYTFQLDFHCQRRPLGESQAMSQFYQCKRNPSEACASPEFRQYLNSVAQTKHNEVNISACSQLLGGSGSYGGSNNYSNNHENGGAEFR